MDQSEHVHNFTEIVLLNLNVFDMFHQLSLLVSCCISISDYAFVVLDSEPILLEKDQSQNKK